MAEFSVFLADESAQLALAAALSRHTPAGTVIFLQGELGAGKTTLVRGFLQALGHIGAVKSPTYTLVEPYQINGQSIYHFDLYRLGEPDELEYAGGRDYFDGESICLIEWPEKAAGYLPVADVLCELTYEARDGVQGRACTLQANTEKGQKIIASLSN